MLPTSRIALPSACLLAIAAVPACQDTSSDVAYDSAPAAEVVTDGPAPAPAITSEAGPVSERDLAEQREFEEAIRGLSVADGLLQVQPLGKADPARARQHFDEGLRLAETNQRAPAIKAFADAVRTAPEEASLYIGLGDALVAKGKAAMATATYRSAVGLDEGLLDARVKLATTLAMDSRYEEAIDAMNGVLALDADHAIAHERLGIWHYYAGDYQQAWAHVHQQRRLGRADVPQFVALLERQMPDPSSNTP